MGTGAPRGAKSRPDRGLSRLPPRDRQALRAWLTAARGSGIDRVEDLGSRAWSSPRPEFILGVFQIGDPLAAWLVVGDQGAWAVGTRANGAVSARYTSLACALTTVRPVTKSRN